MLQNIYSNFQGHMKEKILSLGSRDADYVDLLVALILQTLFVDERRYKKQRAWRNYTYICMRVLHRFPSIATSCLIDCETTTPAYNRVSDRVKWSPSITDASL